jgi:hypothetical protein
MQLKSRYKPVSLQIHCVQVNYILLERPIDQMHMRMLLPSREGRISGTAATRTGRVQLQLLEGLHEAVSAHR